MGKGDFICSLPTYRFSLLERQLRRKDTCPFAESLCFGLCPNRFCKLKTGLNNLTMPMWTCDIENCSRPALRALFVVDCNICNRRLCTQHAAPGYHKCPPYKVKRDSAPLPDLEDLET